MKINMEVLPQGRKVNGGISIPYPYMVYGAYRVPKVAQEPQLCDLEKT